MEHFLTIDEVATALRVSRWSITRYIKAGQLRVIKVEGRNGAVRIPLSAYEDFVLAHTVTASEETR